MTDVSIWLVPKKEQELQLQKIIDELARKYKACSFIPHITAYYLDASMKPEEVIAVVDTKTKDLQPFTIEAEGIIYSDIFTKTLYLQYQISETLQKLYQRLKSRFQSAYDYSLSPHISLIYKNGISTQDKEYEKQRIQYPQTLALDRIMVITKKGETIVKEQDVLDWKIAYEKTFGK